MRLVCGWCGACGWCGGWCAVGVALATCKIPYIQRLVKIPLLLKKMSLLSYDVIKIILEIKYKNWLKEKKCVCGNDNFKECDIAECFACENNYCSNQPGYSSWVWECRDCYEWFCGKHDFYITPSYSKICVNCVGGAYEIPFHREILTVPKHHLLAIEIRHQRLFTPGSLVYNSPEY